MDEIIDFVKDILMLENAEKSPVGLCGFEQSQENKKNRAPKNKRKRELRLSELME